VFNQAAKQKVERTMNRTLIVVKPNEVMGTRVVELANLDVDELSVRLDENILNLVLEFSAAPVGVVINWFFRLLEHLTALLPKGKQSRSGRIWIGTGSPRQHSIPEERLEPAAAGAISLAVSLAFTVGLEIRGKLAAYLPKLVVTGFTDFHTDLRSLSLLFTSCSWFQSRVLPRFPQLLLRLPMPLQHLSTSSGLQEVVSAVPLIFGTALVLKCEQPRTRTFRIGAHSPVLSPVASEDVEPTATAGAIFAQAFTFTVWLEVCRQLLDDIPESFMALVARV
jgi:hypothetical protein